MYNVCKAKTTLRPHWKHNFFVLRCENDIIDDVLIPNFSYRNSTYCDFPHSNTNTQDYNLCTNPTHRNELPPFLTNCRSILSISKISRGNL